MEQKRLSKVIAEAGICSRRKAEEIIFEGRVKVNGEYVNTPDIKVDPVQDRILIDEAVRVRQEPKKYFLLNKPKGYICSNERAQNKRIVMDLFPKIKQRLFSVGRLDKDTIGLLLITNDGEFANQIIHPSSNIIKEYQVKVKEEIQEIHLEKLRKGAFIDKRKLKPYYVKKIKWNVLLIGIKEGKKHEVRIFISKANLRLQELKRTKIGALTLGKLPVGAFRQLTKKDNEKIFS